jgi:hypothetical protein
MESLSATTTTPSGTGISFDRESSTTSLLRVGLSMTVELKKLSLKSFSLFLNP